MAASTPPTPQPGGPADAGQRICVTLQLGTAVEHVNVALDAREPHAALYAVREVAHRMLLARAEPDQRPAIGADRVLLLRHDYASPNMLALVTDPMHLHNGAVLEVVLLSHNDRPAAPHSAELHSYIAPTFCNLCGEILVGLVRQGFRCTRCHLNYHRHCVHAPFNNCAMAPALGEASVATSPEQAKLQQSATGLPHTFAEHNYTLPTVCSACDKLLMGIIKQGMQCRDCKVNVHKKCMHLVPSNCRPTEAPVPSSAAQPPSQQQKQQQAAAEAATQPMATDDDGAGPHLIPAQRIPGSVGVLHSRPPSQLLSGWLLHFTNRFPERRLRHLWVLEPDAICLYSEGNRLYQRVCLSQVLDVRQNAAGPLDGRHPPHAFEIVTAELIYYVGERLDYYRNGPHAQVTGEFRSESVPTGHAPTSDPNRWYETLRGALLPPTGPRAQPNVERPMEFSAIYQVNANEELGSGQFGTVYGGVHRQSGRQVAVKLISKERFGKRQQNQLWAEVNILHQVSHPGIIKLESMYHTNDKIYVVMEKMEADMLEMILSSVPSRLDERHTKFLIKQILHALAYLHSKDIAHCDLKPENVLLNDKRTDLPQTKLCDFGYARCIEEAQFRSTMVGTPAYLAPEVLQRRKYNKSIDMWAVGVVVYVTLSGTFPFNEREDIAQQIQDANFMYPDQPWAEISKDAIDFIGRLLKVDIEFRATIDQCLLHKWLDDARLYLDVKQLEARLNVRYITSAADDAKYEHQGRLLLEQDAEQLRLQQQQSAAAASAADTQPAPLNAAGPAPTMSVNMAE